MGGWWILVHRTTGWLRWWKVFGHEELYRMKFANAVVDAPCRGKRFLRIVNETSNSVRSIYILCTKHFKRNRPRWNPQYFFKGLGGFQRLKTGTFLLFFFYISNEIFYSNSLPYKKYIFDKYFVKFLLENFENSVIGTSSLVTLQKKVLSA